jgi:hypothetical protein
MDNQLKSYEDFINESVDSLELELDELFTEAVRKRTPDQIMKDAEDKIKEQIARFSELMKTKPEKADVYKAQLDLVHAKQTVLQMKKKLEQVKSKY